jgi:hypothetical protein
MKGVAIGEIRNKTYWRRAFRYIYVHQLIGSRIVNDEIFFHGSTSFDRWGHCVWGRGSTGDSGAMACRTDFILTLEVRIYNKTCMFVLSLYL